MQGNYCTCDNKMEKVMTEHISYICDGEDKRMEIYCEDAIDKWLLDRRDEKEV